MSRPGWDGFPPDYALAVSCGVEMQHFRRTK